MKVIFISGAAGFIGSSLARRFLQTPETIVFGLDNFITGNRQQIVDLKSTFPKSFYFIEHDVSQNWQPVQDFFTTIKRQKALSGINFIFHLASPASPSKYLKFPMQTIQANTLGLQNALHFADENHGRLIYSSTSEVYGECKTPSICETDFGELNSFSARACYFESKRLGESILHAFNSTNNKNHGLVRIFNTYGPNMDPDDGRVIPNFIAACLENKSLKIYGDQGKRTRSFCYIDDCTHALIRYAESGFTEPMNIGNDDEISILNLAHLVIDLCKSTSQIEYAPSLLDEPLRRRPNLTLAKSILAPWHPEVSLKAGLQKTIHLFNQTAFQSR